MSEITVGSWNALNAFGDDRASEAVEIVKNMDVDVLYVSEMTERDTYGSEHFEEAADQMRNLGYSKQLFTAYTPYPLIRNAQMMGMWTRDNSAKLSAGVYSQRYGLKAHVPAIDATVYGFHSDDRSENERVAEHTAIAEEAREDRAQAIVMGDLNSIHRGDPAGNQLRRLNKLAAHVEVKDYYDRSKKFQRMAGAALRLCRMTEGRALKVFTNETTNFYDADLMHYRPTWKQSFAGYKAELQLDHILATGKLAVEPDSYTIHPRSVKPDGREISDHNPISATILR